MDDLLHTSCHRFFNISYDIYVIFIEWNYLPCFFPFVAPSDVARLLHLSFVVVAFACTGLLPYLGKLFRDRPRMLGWPNVGWPRRHWCGLKNWNEDDHDLIRPAIYPWLDGPSAFSARPSTGYPTSANVAHLGHQVVGVGFSHLLNEFLLVISYDTNDGSHKVRSIDFVLEYHVISSRIFEHIILHDDALMIWEKQMEGITWVMNFSSFNVSILLTLTIITLEYCFNVCFCFTV